MKMKLCWYSNIFNIIMKCNYSFLFVMIIMPATVNKCNQYGSINLPTSAFSFDCSMKIWHTSSCAGSIMPSTGTFVITVGNNRVPWRPHLEEKLRTLLPLQSLHVRTAAWLPLTIVTSCLEQLNLLTKASTSNGSWRQGIKGEMTCTGYVVLVWNIIYRIMTIIVIIVIIIIIMIIIIIIKRWWWWW